MPMHMQLVAITLDCPDPLVLAAFYEQATGLELHPKSDADFAGRGCGPSARTASEVPQQLHICFKIEGDLEEAEARLLKLGAGKPDHQPHGDKARVLTDPVGHPFCIIRR
ncbi:VOC family protein [Streptomyces parvulus]|uniref:VOC family protein n=1 Tax=Streptomyces parvulus TaxID=146923 RepID=UPI0037F53EF2